MTTHMPEKNHHIFRSPEFILGTIVLAPLVLVAGVLLAPALAVGAARKAIRRKLAQK